MLEIVKISANIVKFFLYDDTSRVANDAVGEVASAGELIEKVLTIWGIAEAGQRIRGVTAQTNLLALNAVIDAARADEAVKGFAMVASAVKSLSKQATNATETISGPVKDLLEANDRAAVMFEELTRAISQIDEKTATVSG